MDCKLIYLLSQKLTQAQNSRFLNFVNIVALISVMIGSLALILSLSILNGFDYKLKETARKFTSDIAIYTINKENIYNVDRVKLEVEKIKGVKNIMPIIHTEGLAATKEYTEGIVLQSLSENKNIHRFDKNLIMGELKFSSDSANEVIIGQTLSQKLNVRTGDKILIYALKNTETISFSSAAYSQFTVKAIYQTGMLQYDERVVFFPCKKLAAFIELPENTATYFEVWVDDVNNVESIATNIEDRLGFPFFPLTYYDLNRSIFSWIELQKEPIPLVLTIISVVAILNIITMLIITVVEKTHSIGILRTLGIDNKKLICIFLFRGIKTALTGSLFGCLISIFFTMLQVKFNLINLDSKIYFLNSLPIKLEYEYFFIIVGMTLIFSLIASFVPALIACRLSPLRAIKFK